MKKRFAVISLIVIVLVMILIGLFYLFDDKGLDNKVYKNCNSSSYPKEIFDNDINNIKFEDDSIIIRGTFHPPEQKENVYITSSSEKENNFKLKIGESLGFYTTEECIMIFKLVNLTSEKAIIKGSLECASPGPSSQDDCFIEVYNLDNQFECEIDDDCFCSSSCGCGDEDMLDAKCFALPVEEICDNNTECVCIDNKCELDTLNQSNATVEEFCKDYLIHCVDGLKRDELEMCQLCYKESCSPAGSGADEYSFGRFIGPKKCCEGLVKIDFKEYENGVCYDFFDVVTICSDCGNGICEEWENPCNCQEDCA